ncbi:helix-turn-helix domain-containing protein [Maribellus sediminis]|uniref:helix-turn-helix domain-containing protein n=1 Tax=Maribellus sediminis TaxID=2696285 RepID=UPI001430C9E3|nr:helix-turn-helix domain-containing protein [Maribellus sediminis]
MNTNTGDDKSFLNRLSSIVEANLSDEHFGVTELADKLRMNRSSVHRKLKSITNKSVSEFIREIRLQKAKGLLEEGSDNVSEVAYNVGFGSPSYFSKCFHDYFGYPPGEAKNHTKTESDPIELTEEGKTTKTFKQPSRMILVVIAITVLLGAYLVYQKLSGNPSEKSVIVLPFKNLSSEESTQYFADGITEDILTQLAKISDLQVVSRTSSEQFRETALSSPEIAGKMNVNFILEGSIRRQNDNVRISVQFIDARHDRHLWSENYDRQLADIFAIQSDIAKNVAKQLQTILSPEEIKQIEKLHPKNAEAYDKYLMGQYLCLKRDSISIRKGIEYFNQALEIDSTYTLAYSGLADGYYALSFTGYIDRKIGYARAYEMAEKALDMDSTLAEAYAVLGIVSKFGYWKWEEARKYFEKAIEVDPNCMVAHLYYCSFLDIVGEPDKAFEQVNRAIELEPYYHMTFRMKGIILCDEKRYEESNEALKRSYELNKESYYNYSRIFLNYLALNDEAAALEKLRELFALRPEYLEYKNDITPLYESSGINSVLKMFLDARLELGNEDDHFLIPILATKLGMQNEALTYLEKACAEKTRDIPRMIRKPELEVLYSNPRFVALVDTMNLSPYFQKLSE